MRIAMVCPSYQPQEVTCGVGDYTRCLVGELVRQGEDIIVIASDHYRASPDDPAPVCAIMRDGSRRQIRQVLSVATEMAADLMHIQYTPDLYREPLGLGLLPILVRLHSRIRTVITFHTLVGASVRSRVLAPLLIATSHCSISANEEVTRLVRRRLPVLARRMVEIPIGANIPIAVAPMAVAPMTVALTTVTTSDRKSLRIRHGIPEGAPLLVHFGLIYPGKGLETLFSALAAIQRIHPQVRLMILGDTRPDGQRYRRSLEALASELGIAGLVTWTGRRTPEDVSQILQASDLFVVPYDDGASIRRGSLMAGLAHGLPIVSTESAHPSAYWQHGVHMILVPPKDVRALVVQVARLLGDPTEAARLGKSALSLSERFSWPAIARETRALYAQVMAR